MAKLFQQEIRFLLEKMEARYANARNGDIGKVGDRHPKKLPDEYKRWRKDENGMYVFVPHRNSLMEALWQIPEIKTYMCEHLNKTQDDSFYPHTYEDLHNPRYAPDGTKEIRAPQLKIYLMYAGIESLEELRMAAKVQPTGKQAVARDEYRMAHLLRYLIAISVFLAGALLGIVAAALYLKPQTEAISLGAPLEFDAYFLATDSILVKDGLWDRASFQFRPFTDYPDSFQVSAQNLYRNSRKIFKGTAVYDNRFLFVQLHEATHKTAMHTSRHFFFIFDLGINTLPDSHNKLIGGNLLSHSIKEKITTGTILLCGKHFPEGKKESTRAIIRDYLHGLPHARNYSTDFPLTGEPEELVQLIKEREESSK
ncbi:MAG TPA: hypothetical protein PKA00_09020 [Saprospiraceae bacterium]|nr:hypothetical protein [Saprospiraceae bacterium]HMQ83037.1 hypothetical protein [Saprospiraceae bacterium]